MSIPCKILFSTKKFILQTRNYASIVKTITVRPSIRPYNELSIISPGKFKIPKKPFDMEIQYADTSPYEKKKHTVIALHGTPGSCYHYEKYFQDFHQSNDLDVRLIAISFPDFRHTRQNGYYWHTTPERVNFLRQFLSDLNIDTVDCFLSHSYSIQTLVALVDDPEDLKIRSLCLIAPHPLWNSIVYSLKEDLKKLFMFNNSVWYKFLEILKIHKKTRIPLEFKSLDDFLYLCSSVAFDDMIERFEDRLRRSVKNTNIPISLMYGTRETVVTNQDISKFNTILGMRDDQIVRLDPSIHTVDDVKDNGKRVNSYMVKDGGHFLHLKYYHLARRVLTNLLAKIEKI